MDSRRAAREWLIFVGSLAVGIGVWPLIAKGLVLPQIRLGNFYLALVGGTNQFVSAWLFALAPYAAVQLIRSVAWAVRQRDSG